MTGHNMCDGGPAFDIADDGGTSIVCIDNAYSNLNMINEMLDTEIALVCPPSAVATVKDAVIKLLEGIDHTRGTMSDSELEVYLLRRMQRVPDTDDHKYSFVQVSFVFRENAGGGYYDIHDPSFPVISSLSKINVELLAAKKDAWAHGRDNLTHFTKILGPFDDRMDALAMSGRLAAEYNVMEISNQVRDIDLDQWSEDLYRQLMEEVEFREYQFN